MEPPEPSAHPRELGGFLQRVGRVWARVVKLNPRSGAPLKLLRASEGEEGKLALFVNWKGEGLPLTGLPGHWRVLTLPLSFRDWQGTRHNYLDFKGIGAPHEIHASHARVIPRAFFRTPWVTRGREHEQMFGLARLSRVLRDWKAAEWLQKSGVRTYTPVAVLELREVLDEEGKPMSVADARREGRIPRNFRPALFLRAHPQLLRVRDLYEWNPRQPLTVPRGLYYETLQKYAAREGFEEPVNYAGWFTREVAANLARLHNAGGAHLNFTHSNLTLDARIVDHEGLVGPPFGRRATTRERATDLRSGLNAVYLLTSAAAANHTVDEQLSLVKREARRFIAQYLKERPKLTPREERELERQVTRATEGMDYAPAVPKAFEERRRVREA